MPQQYTQQELESKFWAKVDRSGDGCWEWQAYRFWHGYGNFKRNGQNVYAHRFAWELANGPIPSGMCVCHHCDNRACVRPDHLFVGTKKDNTQDMMAKGRHRCDGAPGERNFFARLTEADVRFIRSNAHRGQKTLADQFGVTQAAISKVLLRRTWRHI